MLLNRLFDHLFTFFLPDFSSHGKVPMLLDLPNRGQPYTTVSLQARRVERAVYAQAGVLRSLYCLYGYCAEADGDIVLLLCEGEVIGMKRAVYGNAAFDMARFWQLFAGQKLPGGIDLPAWANWQEMKVEALPWPKF